VQTFWHLASDCSCRGKVILAFASRSVHTLHGFSALACQSDTVNGWRRVSLSAKNWLPRVLPRTGRQVEVPSLSNRYHGSIRVGRRRRVCSSNNTYFVSAVHCPDAHFEQSQSMPPTLSTTTPHWSTFRDRWTYSSRSCATEESRDHDINTYVSERKKSAKERSRLCFSCHSIGIGFCRESRLEVIPTHLHA
jgi:hypothetical protein